MWRILWLYCLIICCDTSWSTSSSLSQSLDNGSLLLPVDLSYKLKLIEHTSRIFCNSQVKVVNVYFENDTSSSYPGKILNLLNDCGISHVSIRNKFRTSKLDIIKDDGIIMYLVMVIRDITQNVKFNIIRKKSASKHLTFIMLMVENSDSITEIWLHKTFQHYWDLWILNVAIICYRANKLHIYRYDPFSQKLHPMTFRGDHNHRLKVSDIFPKKMLNMQRQPLRMCMYDDGVRTIFTSNNNLLGSDGFMATYFAERLNATRFVNRVNLYGNTSISRDLCFKEIVEELDDVAVNIRFLSLATFYNRAENTVVHSRDDLCVMVPKAKIASSFWNLFRSFNHRVWIFIIATLLLANGFCFLNYRQICFKYRLVLQLYACMISMPFTKLRRPTSLRIFLCVWLVYGMLISAAYKGNLTGNLVDRKFLPDINTLRDLAESSYPLATLPRHVKHLQRYLDPRSYHASLLLSKMIEIPDLQFAHLVNSNNLSFAYLQKKHLSVFRAHSRKHTCNGKPLYHVMRQCIVPFHAVFIVPYGSPYLGYINNLMRSAQEFGFINYWERFMTAVFRSSRRSNIRNRRNDDDPEVLRLQHFHAVFFLLILGLILSSLCFIWELVQFKYFKKIY